MERKLLALSICVLLLLSCATASQAAETDFTAAVEFFKGKDITLIVPLGAGGGMDNAARISAPFLQELTGARRVLVENMTGASGVVAYNWLYESAERDGTVFCFGSHPSYNKFVQQADACNYDPSAFNYIGTVQHTSFCLTVHPDSPYADVEKFKSTNEFIIGGFAYNDSMSLYASITLKAMNISKPLLIGGYGTAANVLLAMAQGEVDGYTSPLDSLFRYVEGKQCVPVCVYSKERDTFWPNVPTIYELFDINDETRTLLELMPESDRIIFAPPEVPADRVAFLEKCVMDMFEKPEFREQVIASTGYFSGALNAAETTAVNDFTVANADSYLSLGDLLKQYVK